MSEPEQYVTVERYNKLVAYVKQLVEQHNTLVADYSRLVERMEYIDKTWDTIMGVNDAIKRGESLQASKAREKRDLARQYAKAKTQRNAELEAEVG